MCQTGFTGTTVVRALMHVEVPFHFIVQIVVTGVARSAGTTLLHIDFRGLVVAYGHLQVVAAISAAAT